MSLTWASSDSDDDETTDAVEGVEVVILGDDR
jgi:hypothetical protein